MEWIKKFFRKKVLDKVSVQKLIIELNLTDIEKKQLIDRSLKEASKTFYAAFILCELKTHICGKIYFDNTDEWFEISFNKILEPPKNK